MAILLEGEKVANSVYKKILDKKFNQKPRLVFIRVGENEASKTYVRMKEKRCEALGFIGETIIFEDQETEENICKRIGKLNNDKTIHGILVQLPLPDHLNKQKILRTINPMKDVDGLHPENIGLLIQGKPRFIPCTAAGILEIINFYNIPLEGKKVVIVGRSEIVGKPTAILMLLNNATVTICHSKTINLYEETNKADILISAIGKKWFITKKHVKKNATVIDVGINRIEGKLYGDVNFDEVEKKAYAITPVPGGVGKMTIAMLMYNLSKAVEYLTS